MDNFATHSPGSKLRPAGPQRWLLAASVGVLFVCTGAFADDRWVYVGDLQLPTTRATGKLSLNLASLRRRGQHYEIWERVVFEVDAAKRFITLASDAVPERRKLWAIRCRSGSLAVVTEGEPGAFEPRAEKLAFYVPAPTSADAAVIDIACSEARRLAAEQRTPTVSDDDAKKPALAFPPSLFESDGLDEADE
ncbi:hypothetical protein [Rhodocyclus tenuis]|uniref:hypothetical protein n=1 Tax=Rhodocyclus tenuis TaxID=1066 RepID=UPI001907B2D4|nr:hypothetical protein [Rhodocyclus tenuis]MBK1681324.1 hypothetical protein [Rhodocyclus tenuis]